MPALSSQQRPRTSSAPSDKRPAVVALSVTVVGVAAPARTGGEVGLEHGVDDVQRILHQRVAGLANAVTYQLEKSAVNDFRHRKLILSAGRTIANRHELARDAFVAVGIADVDGIDADVVALDAGDEEAVVGDGPVFDVSLEEVGVLLEELRGGHVTAVAREAGCANQSGDIGGQRRGRVAGVLLPSLLRGGRAVVDQEVSRPQDHRIRIEILEPGALVQPPRQHDRKRDFVELNAVDPEILRKAAVRTLRACEINESAQRGGDVSRGGQTAHAVDHVARPDEMIAAEVLVALGLAPRDAERSDERAGIGLVFMGEQQLGSAAIESAVVAGEFIERNDMTARAMPLLEESSTMLRERLGQRLIQRRHGAIELAAEAEAKRERVALAQIDLGGERDVAVECGGELIIHLEIGADVLPSVGIANVSARRPEKRRHGSQSQPDA